MKYHHIVLHNIEIMNDDDQNQDHSKVHLTLYCPMLILIIMMTTIMIMLIMMMTMMHSRKISFFFSVPQENRAADQNNDNTNNNDGDVKIGVARASRDNSDTIDTSDPQKVRTNRISLLVCRCEGNHTLPLNSCWFYQ